MNRRLVAIVAATVLALLGASMVFFYGRSADARAQAGQELRAVYVSGQLIPSGTTLKDAMDKGLLSKTSVIAKGAPANALTAVSADNESLVALANIAPGQYVLASAFGETPVGTSALQVPKGKLAISVQLEDPARVGEFVTPGSHLSIFASTRLKKLGTSKEAQAYNDAAVTGTQVLLPDVLVIAMGQASLTPAQNAAKEPDATEGQQAAQANTFLVTVAVDPKQGARLIHGINNYKLYAGLRSNDVNVPDTLGTDDLTIFPSKGK